MVLILSVSRTRRSHHRRHQLKPTIEALPIGTSGRRTHTCLNSNLSHLAGTIVVVVRYYAPQSSVETNFSRVHQLFVEMPNRFTIFFWLLRLIYCRPKNEANCTNSWLIYICFSVCFFYFFNWNSEL